MRTQASWQWRSALPLTCSGGSPRRHARQAGAPTALGARLLRCGWRSACTPTKPCSSAASRRCLRATVRRLHGVCGAAHQLASRFLSAGHLLRCFCVLAHQLSHTLAKKRGATQAVQVQQFDSGTSQAQLALALTQESDAKACCTGCLLVHAHCYLHRPSLVPFGHRIPVAPHYLLKLKSCDAVRMVRLPQASPRLGAWHARMPAVRSIGTKTPKTLNSL